MNGDEKDKLDAVIVRNMSQINAALSRMWFGIDPQAFGAIDGTAKEWALTQGWEGGFKFLDDEELWFAPPNWTVTNPDGDDGHYASLEFGHFESEWDTEGGDQDKLITLLGAGVGSMGIRICRGDNATVTKPVWRRLAAETDVVRAMVALGFALEDKGSYFLPIPFKATALADGIEQGDMSAFLAPLTEALNRLPDAVRAMQPVINAASQPASGAGSRR